MKNKKQTKYVFVTGGVISGVGKGIMAASIGTILKAKGLKVSMQKCDPYFNVDAGLLDPREHGETFVTRDGAETDLDLGHYERFLDEEMTGNSTLSSGKLYKRLIDAERAGQFGGKTVQLVPHVTGLAQQSFLDNAEYFGSDVHIVEIGGTVGDMEGQHFIEAIRSFATKVGRENCMFVHVCYVPWLSTSQEFKTKPAQNSLRDLREFGIIPDMVVARMDVDHVLSAPQVSKKLATFCGVNEDSVILMPDAKSVYEVPLNAVKGGILNPLERFVDHGDPDLSVWEDLMKKIEAKPSKSAKVALIAKYIDNTDMYLSTSEALKAAAWKNNIKLELDWLDAETATEKDYAKFDGFVVPDGYGTDDAEGKIRLAEYCLAKNVPYFGIGFGLHAAVIAEARKQGNKKADSEEFGKKSDKNIVIAIDEGRKILGNGQIKLEADSKVAKLYNDQEITERRGYRYAMPSGMTEKVEGGGLKVVGTSLENGIVEIVEAEKCDFFVGIQSHPEYRSRPYRAHPLFDGFIKAIKSGK